MHWRVMSAKEKVNDIALPKAEYQENALFKALIFRPSECLVLPEGTLALVGMSLGWRDVQIYPAFRTTDRENSASILAVDRPLHLGEENILRAHAGKFLISPSHMGGVLQGFPTGRGVEESGGDCSSSKKDHSDPEGWGGEQRQESIISGC
ncbi:hypothetical protein Hanom_Chr13g01212741 [Helianthus anomalus]